MRLSRLLVAAALALSSVPARALQTEVFRPTGARAAAGAPPFEVVSGEAIIRFSSGTTVAQKRATLAAARMDYANEIGSTGWTRVYLPTGTLVAPGLDLLAALSRVAEVAPNHAYRPVRSPNDPLANAQYALSRVSAPAAWEYEVGDSNLVTVAIADTGIDRTHSDLATKLAATTSQFCDPGGDKNSTLDNTACVAQAATDACGHGTTVAGIAAASTNNGAVIAGMSWGARLVSLKLFRDADCAAGCGGAACSTDDQAIAHALAAAQALQNTAAHGKIVVNLSVGGNIACSGVVQAAVTAAVGAGVVIVASSGNSPNCGGSNVNSPARCVGVIPAGATTSTDVMASFSCPGTELASFGVAAPGASVLTTAMGGGTESASGTSFSSPMVAGLAALVYAQKPNFTPAQIQNAIRAGAESIGAPATSQGAGRINAYRTLRFAVNGTLAGFDGEVKPIAFPNPFKPGEIGTVAFAIPPGLQGSALGIKIYTLEGVFVREINGLSWNGKNADGNPVASGTYVFVVTTSAGTGRGRVSVLR